MQIDTNFMTATACKIQPFKANFNDTTNVTHLGVVSLSDNFKDACTLGWSLMDESGTVYAKGSIDMNGADYAGWDGDNLFPFSFVGNKLGLIFI